PLSPADFGAQLGPDGSPTPITSPDQLSRSQAPVGDPLTSEADAQSIIRELANGRTDALRALGIEPPDGFDPTSTEWGIGRRPDGSYIIIKGGPTAVDWGPFPDVVAVAHSHPDMGSNHLQNVDADGGVSVAQIIANDGPDRVHFLPSGADLVFVATRGINEHTVITPFQSLGNGRVGNPIPGANNAGVNIVMRNPQVVGTLFGNDSLPMVRADIEVRGQDGEILWTGPIYGANHPNLGSLVMDGPPPFMTPTVGDGSTGDGTPTGGLPSQDGASPDPQAPRPDDMSARPDGSDPVPLNEVDPAIADLVEGMSPEMR